MTPSSDQRQAVHEIRRTRSDRPARFRREAGRDYPAGYLAQLARPLLSRKQAKTGPAAGIQRPRPEASTG